MVTYPSLVWRQTANLLHRLYAGSSNLPVTVLLTLFFLYGGKFAESGRKAVVLRTIGASSSAGSNPALAVFPHLMWWGNLIDNSS